MRRVVSVWLPDWPVTVWSRTAGRAPPDPATPFALVERAGSRGLVLSALNPAARAVGLRLGQSHADARAILPDLVSAPAEPDRDAAALRRLALWAERFSPAVAVDAAPPGQEGLVLDMTGGCHLFGGEAALLAELVDRLAAAGVGARAAIADTAGAAWAMARYGRETIIPEGGTREALAALPVSALRLDDEAVALLRRFGLKRIGDLYALPRAGLARRFRGSQGLEVVRRLDQALGEASEPLEPVRPPPKYRAWRVFAEPLAVTESVAHALPDLAGALAGQLDRDGLGVRRLVLTGFRVDGATTRIEAGLSAPSHDVAHLLRVLKEKGLERLDLGFGVDALMLGAVVVEPAAARQQGLDPDGEKAAPEALAGLLDRLQARLGEGAVRRPAPQGSWRPERSERWVPVQAGGGDPLPPPDRPRPVLMFHPPEPVETLAELPDGLPARFVWRRVARRVMRAEGPERLAAEWWREADPERPARTRDYYRVEDEHGRRYWLFREGLYGREDDGRAPEWRLHGVFA